MSAVETDTQRDKRTDETKTGPRTLNPIHIGPGRRETPFRLAYYTDALLPVKVGLESYRHDVFNMETNERGLQANTDLFEEDEKRAT